MEDLSALERDGPGNNKAAGDPQKLHAGERRLYRTIRVAFDTLWYLQARASAYTPTLQCAGRSPPAKSLPPCVSPYRGGPSAGGRRGSQRDSCLAGTRRSGNNQPVCRNQPPHETKSAGGLPTPGGQPCGDLPPPVSLAGRCGSPEMVESPLIIMWPTLDARSGNRGWVFMLAT